MTYTASSPVDTQFDSTLTAADVEDWFGASDENYGVRWATNIIPWHSSEAATAAYRPKLTVEYTEARRTLATTGAG
jgi:hypothetical protein